MCRWAAYIGTPIFLSDVILDPARSLVSQSSHAFEAKTQTNGDGFGLAWYQEHPFPGHYRDVMPAWADGNLGSMANQIRARLFMAHVRASTGTSVSRSNCHPFVSGNWSFMHNGQFGGYSQFRQKLDAMLPPDLYNHRLGTTDSEAAFLLSIGYGLEESPKRALEEAIGTMEEMSIKTRQSPHARVSLAISNGDDLYVVRYASDRFAPSLYHRATGKNEGRLVVSEPLDEEAEQWEEIPTNSFAKITKERVQIEEFTPIRQQNRSERLLDQIRALEKEQLS